MKKTAIRRLVVLTLCLTMVSLSLIGGTLAKYTTTVSGTDTVAVAKWDYTFNNAGTTFTLDLVPDTWTNVVAAEGDNKVIAPGMSGSFQIVVAGTSQVASTYSITMTRTGTTPKNLNFYLGSDNTGTKITSTGTIASDVAVAADASAATTYTVYWEWPIGTDAELDQDSISTGNVDMTVTIECIATQVAPAKQTASNN